MLLHLVRKDFLLAKKYWIVILAAAFMLPIFIRVKQDMMPGGFLPFFISTLYNMYLLFNSVSMMEFKYKGAALLCAAPYSRTAMVQAKYVLILILFAASYGIYTFVALIPAFGLPFLEAAELARAFFICCLLFGMIIPVQLRYGYENSRYLFFFLIFLTPFILPVLMNLLQDQEAGFTTPLHMNAGVEAALLAIGALLVLAVSLRISIRVYWNKDL